MKIIQIQIFLILAFTSCLIATNSTAQKIEGRDKDILFVEPGFKLGKMIDIFPGSPISTESYFAEINIGYQSIGNQWWNSYYNYPRPGLMLSYGFLGNKELVGNAFSILPNMALKIVEKRKFSLVSRIGLGFSWFFNPYDRIENPKNNLIGARVTQFTQLSIDANISLTNRIILVSGISLQHYSTGHVQIPNVGINIPTINLGLIYFPHKVHDKIHFRDTVFDIDKRFLFNIQFGLGIHEIAFTTVAIGGPKYPVYGGALYVSKRLGMILSLQMGVHVNYYTSYYDYIVAHDFYSNEERLKSFTITPFVGAELFVGRFGFAAQLGIYAYNPFANDVNALLEITGGKKNSMKRLNANRLGTKYYILDQARSGSKKPYVGLLIKTNAGQADFVELNIGCAF